MKNQVGVDLSDDRRRLGILRGEVGPGAKIMVDANQVRNESVSQIRFFKT